MSDWVLVCNSNYYDVGGAFKEFNKIDWKQNNNIQDGELVYIYVGQPICEIRYACIANKVDLSEEDIDDSKYVLSGSNYENYGRYMELELVEEYNNKLLGYKYLKKNGLNSIQGPSRVTNELSAYISKVTQQKKKTRQELIIDVLAKQNKPMTAKELTDIIYPGKHQSNVFSELQYMEQQGLINRSGTPAKCYFELVSRDSQLEGTEIQMTVDSEAEMLILQAVSANDVSGLIKAFVIKLKEYQKKQANLEVLRQKFISDFNFKKLQTMILDEYVVGKQSKTSFCYRVETELKELGNINGIAGSFKFGVYYSQEDGKYIATNKFGPDSQTAFDKIKLEICQLLVAARNKDYKAINGNIISPMFKGKILYLYFPDSFLSIYASTHLDFFLRRAGIYFDDAHTEIDKQQMLLDWKNANSIMKDWSPYVFGRFLYESFGNPSDLDKVAKSRQEKRDKNYPGEYVSKVNITINKWMELIKDTNVFYESDIELMKRFYAGDNHAGTCTELVEQDGAQPSSFIIPVVALAKRISEATGLLPIRGKDNKQVWWRILFWGRYTEEGLFEWKVRPKLAKAMERLYPELETEAANEEEDKRLVEELRNFKTAPDECNVQYNKQPKPRTAAKYTNGHKVYPRDRQIAQNALALAHHECECDRTHWTFKKKNSNINYTEPHHLVPMAYSDRFIVSLDREQNIVSLCSNCHNHIHYGAGVEEMLKKLYVERKDLLKEIEINITLEELLKMY